MTPKDMALISASFHWIVVELTKGEKVQENIWDHQTGLGIEGPQQNLGTFHRFSHRHPIAISETETNPQEFLVSLGHLLVGGNWWPFFGMFP